MLFPTCPKFYLGCCGKNSLNACGNQEKTCHKKMSDLPQEFDKFFPQASTFFSILEFFYECRYVRNFGVNRANTGIMYSLKRFGQCFVSVHAED